MDTVYLVFKKEFDKVPHRRLLAKVRACGMAGQVANWIANWFSDRRVGGCLAGSCSSCGSSCCPARIQKLSHFPDL